LSKNRILQSVDIKQLFTLQIKLSYVELKLSTVISDALIRDANPNRSPSPPPIYDENGKRTNNTEARMKSDLMKIRSEVIESIIKIFPTFSPPSDYIRTKVFEFYLFYDDFGLIDMVG